MASNIANGTTFGSDTGTGQSFEPYRLNGQDAVYRELSPVAQAALLTFKAVEPKKTSDYLGSMRGEFKFRREYADSLGKLWPAVVTISASLPAFLTDTQRAAIITEVLLLSRKNESKDCLSKLSIPQ